MRTHRHPHTRLKILGAFIFGAIAVALLAIWLPSVLDKTCTMGGPLSNMKQLQLATQQMALDATTAGRTNLGLPGEMGGSFTNWINQLVPAYLGTNDIAKLLSSPTQPLSPDVLPSANTNAILVYAVREDSPGDTVIFSTANFINTPQGGYINPAAHSYGDKMFAIFRRDGSGALLKAKQAGDTNAIGSYAPLCQ